MLHIRLLFLNRIKISDVERNWYKKYISEILLIKTNKTINKQTNTKN